MRQVPKADRLLVPLVGDGFLISLSLTFDSRAFTVRTPEGS
jgi:hypothetical protein